MLRTLVLMDYQNIHLTAHDHFAPTGTPKHETLVHPLHFGNQVIAARNVEAMRPDRMTEKMELGRVVVYRGMPSNKHNPKSYQRSQAQRSEWTKDSRVEVVYRPLRYHNEGGQMVAREKGVDVMLALALVSAARLKDFDVVVLASHDTDLEPAIDEAVGCGGPVIETVGWHNCKRLRPAVTVWHTFLKGDSFVRCRDRKQYA